MDKVGCGFAAALSRGAYQVVFPEMLAVDHPTLDPSWSNCDSQLPESTGELTLKMVGESKIGTTDRGIDFCDCSSNDPGWCAECARSWLGIANATFRG